MTKPKLDEVVAPHLAYAAFCQALIEMDEQIRESANFRTLLVLLGKIGD
jgi:hypothetical protein